MTGRFAPALALGVLPLAVGLSSAATPVPRCHTTNLRVYLSRFGAAAGTVVGDVAFRNRSGHACFVSGYAGFGLEDSHHRVKPSRVTWGSTVARRDPGRHRVVLRPGRAAFANLSYGDVQVGNEHCSPSAWLEVTPPDERRYRLVPFGGIVCNHGHLTATALSRTKTPHG
jgi:uncharacterized protein DUF4232